MLNFSLRELKHNETKVAEEYCWAITQAAGRPCCGQSGSSWGADFNRTLLYVHIYVHVVDRMSTDFRLALNSTCAGPSECNYCVSWSVSVKVMLLYTYVEGSRETTKNMRQDTRSLMGCELNTNQTIRQSRYGETVKVTLKTEIHAR
jgi:hypothetical protein